MVKNLTIWICTHLQYRCQLQCTVLLLGPGQALLVAVLDRGIPIGNTVPTNVNLKIRINSIQGLAHQHQADKHNQLLTHLRPKKEISPYLVVCNSEIKKSIYFYVEYRNTIIDADTITHASKA